MNKSTTTTTKTTKKCAKAKFEPAPNLEKYLGQAYILDRSDNYEEFLLELGVKKHIRLKAMASKPTVVLSRLKRQYVLSTSYPEGRYIRVKFKPGKEVRRWENSTSSVFHITDNKLIEEQTTDDKKVLIEREFNKNELIVTMEVNGVKCTRWYTRLKDSKHSINTETSRRTYLWDDTLEVPSTQSTQKTKDVTPEEVSASEDENVCY